MFSFIIKETLIGVMSCCVPFHIIYVKIPSSLPSDPFPFCFWLTILHISFSVCMHEWKYAVLSSISILQITASSDSNVWSVCVPVMPCPQQCFVHILNIFLSRCESMLKFIAGRSLFTQFLFVWFCFNATWKFTPLFEITR